MDYYERLAASAATSGTVLAVATARASLSMSLLPLRQILVMRLLLFQIPVPPTRLTIPIVRQLYMLLPPAVVPLRPSSSGDVRRIAMLRHLSFTQKYLRLGGRLDEVDLQEGLEVQVRHLVLVRDAQGCQILSGIARRSARWGSTQ